MMNFEILFETLPKELVLFEVLKSFNPYTRDDLRHVLRLRELRDDDGQRLVTDDDLREVFFKHMWGFEDRDFVFPVDLSAEEACLGCLVDALNNAHERMNFGMVHILPVNWFKRHPICACCSTAEEIMLHWGLLRYVPWPVFEAHRQADQVVDVLEDDFDLEYIADNTLLDDIELDNEDDFFDVFGHGLIEFACAVGMSNETIDDLVDFMVSCREMDVDVNSTCALYCALKNGHLDTAAHLVESYGAWVCDAERRAASRYAGPNKDVIVQFVETHGRPN